MNRCPPPWINHFFIALLAALTLASSLFSSNLSAQETVRPFPPQALRGELVVTQPPEVTINGIGRRLAPGARIRGANNMLVQPASLVGQAFIVNFTSGAQGLVQDVWILTDAERQQKREGAEGSAGNFRFFSDADRTPRDDGKTPFNQLPKFGQPGSTR